MALWGKADDIYSPGQVTVDYANKTITGAGTSFLAVGIVPGVVISIGAGATLGEAVVSEITSETQISIASTQFLVPGISGAEYTLSQKPVYTMQDSHWSGLTTTTSLSTNGVFGVDEYEGSSVQFVSHVGWVGIKTYVDAQGEVRTKTETLVAMSGISTDVEATYTAIGDAADDTLLPDRFITISVQPQSASVGVGTTVVFSVTASATPSAALSYQWQKSTTSGGTTFSDIGGATSSTVSISNTNTSNNGYLYRVSITSTGGASKISDAATLTVSV
jgi:hypothetical protein